MGPPGNLCDYATYRADNLKTHMKIHNGEKSHKCTQCDYACDQAGNLKTHMKIHSGEKQYKKRNSIGLYVNNESSKRFKINNQDMNQRATTNEELEEQMNN